MGRGDLGVANCVLFQKKRIRFSVFTAVWANCV